MQADQVREDLEGGVAQADVQVDISSIDQIEQLVNKATWRELLLDIVSSSNMDPWNIDIGTITVNYIDKVKKMKINDLHVPANVILAASILLRFKAQAFQFEEPEPAQEEVTVFEGMPGDATEMQLLQLKMRMQPKRAVTLSDLLVALDEAIIIETKRETKRVAVPKMVEFKLPEYDIEKEMKEVLTQITKLSDKEGWLTFSYLLSEMKREGARSLVLTLLPLLHLCQEGKISIMQDDIFGEILVHRLSLSEMKQGEEDDRE